MRRGFVVKTAFLVGAIRLGLWLLPFKMLRRLVNRLTERSAGYRNTGWPSSRQIALTVMIVSRYVPRATCLTQALTAQILLKRYGHPAELKIGVARGKAGELQAHAWVTSDGVVIIGGDEAELTQQYATFPAWEGECS